ncbi:hypothetical protein AB0953_16325 [Streptomyces sp. NPDC046866]|uniref:hypothetical protein n=1 Tax=Streptomyces sp. NPDC046866 TaxID=3154921 RepID=UPI003453287B
MASQDTDTFCHLPHPWIGQTVRDIACGQTGRLTAVVQEPAGFASGRPRQPRLAYIRAASGVEWTTAVSNLELAT